MLHGELRKSQQRMSPHMPQMYPQPPSHIVHFNHPQQGGYPINSQSPQQFPQQGSRLLMPPSPKKQQMQQSPSNSQLSYGDPRVAISRDVQKMAQMMMAPQTQQQPQYIQQQQQYIQQTQQLQQPQQRPSLIPVQQAPQPLYPPPPQISR